MTTLITAKKSRFNNTIKIAGHPVHFNESGRAFFDDVLIVEEIVTSDPNLKIENLEEYEKALNEQKFDKGRNTSKSIIDTQLKGDISELQKELEQQKEDSIKLVEENRLLAEEVAQLEKDLKAQCEIGAEVTELRIENKELKKRISEDLKEVTEEIEEIEEKVEELKKDSEEVVEESEEKKEFRIKLSELSFVKLQQECKNLPKAEWSGYKKKSDLINYLLSKLDD